MKFTFWLTDKIWPFNDDTPSDEPDVLTLEKETPKPPGKVILKASFWSIVSLNVMFILIPTFVFTVIYPFIGAIAKFSNTFGFRSLTVVVQVSTSYPFVKDVILIKSEGYNVGGDMKLLIWKDTIWPVETAVENIDEACTVKAA